jgi:hypothetical protein
MGFELRTPSITAPTDRERLAQITSYLYQLVPQLQWALDNLDDKVLANDKSSKSIESTSPPTQETYWTNLGLSDRVERSETAVGRRESAGCHYRVCEEGRHIYVAFNCAFAFSGNTIEINANNIPIAYRPGREVYAMCAVECTSGERAIARVVVTPLGKVLVEWVQVITASTESEQIAVKWIDGYIDFWI